MTHETTREIFLPFELGDPGGILFFAHVFSLSHQLFEQFILEHICSWEHWFQNPEWIVPIKKTESIYFHPLQVGKICSVKLKFESKTVHSFQLSYQFFQPVLCCEVKTIHVFCNRKNKIKIPIPTELKFFC